ncbi:GNAT family N-acetyltransferase [Marinicrinis lubricantis]|uniref:GNAT family N-acetyltransferase n=1 Tax=Marinicrinis lubricantis TaxID=2086470 RepID=A0ABW1ITF5_9BACL
MLRPVTAADISHLIEQSEMDYMKDRMLAIQEREGNPEGIEIKEIDTCLLLYSRTMAWGQFNNVKGPFTEEHIPEISRFFDERNRNFEFHVAPHHDRNILRALAENGYFQASFHGCLYGEPRQLAANRPSRLLHIRELREDEMEIYAEIHCLGTGLPLDGKAYVAANNKVLYGRKGWHFFIGFAEDQPASVSVMYMKDKIASFTFAATLPQFRGRGFHTQMLQQRLEVCAQHNCHLVVAQAAYGSQSMKNMERAGLRIGYTRANWVKI